MKKIIAVLLLLHCGSTYAQTPAPAQSLLPVTVDPRPQHTTGRHSAARTTSISTFGPDVPNITTSAQWHTNIDNDDHAEDWTYSIIETDQKNLIAVGYAADNNGRHPAFFKLDNRGKLVWIHKETNYTGTYFTVIKAPGDIFVVVGQKTTPPPYPNAPTPPKQTILATFDKDGNYVVTPQVFHPSLNTVISGSSPEAIGNTVYESYGASVALDPLLNSPDHLIISGCIGLDGSPLFYGGYITTVDISGGSIDLSASQTFVYSNHTGTNTNAREGGSLLKKLVTKPTSGSTYDIYSCGFVAASSTDFTQYAASNATSQGVTANIFDKDAWLVKLEMNSATLSLSKQWQFNKSNITVGGNPINTNYTATYYPYQEVGPFTARNCSPNNSTGEISGSLVTVPLNAYNNIDERATDMILNADGKLALVVNVNMIGNSSNGSWFITNGKNLIASNGNVVDYYDEYMDCDAFFVEIDPDDNISTSFPGKNVAHFSGLDFTPSIIQDQMGRYIIAGSTADTYPGSEDPNLPESIANPSGKSAAALIVCTDDNHTTDIWRRSFVANDDRQDDEDNNEFSFCLFGMTNTADDGYVIVGNNELHDDDFSITKFAPVNENVAEGISYYTFGEATPPAEYHVTGTETWTYSNKPYPMYIATKIIVDPGATLNIVAELYFASAANVYDYLKFPSSFEGSVTDHGVGIVVRPGGTLNIMESTLGAISFPKVTTSGDDRNMWDGIIVQGDPTSNYAGDQGKVTMENTLIENAVYGLYVSDNYRTFTNTGTVNTGGFSGNTYSSRYNGYADLGGGIAEADYCAFRNCRFGFTFQGYTGKLNASHFTGCEFNTSADGMADICFFTDENGNNIPASTYGSSWEGRVNIIDNTFTCDQSFPLEQRPTGLIAANAAMNVTRSCAGGGSPFGCATPGTGNTFSNLLIGITVGGNVGRGSAGTRIAYNTFSNNYVSVQATGVMTSLQVSNNNVYVPTSSYGMTFAGCQGYDISLNHFDQYAIAANDYGIVVNNGITSSNDIVKNNYFTNFGYPCVALGTNGSDNSGLQFHCNTFDVFCYTGLTRLSSFTPLINIPGSFANPQGSCRTTTSPAGNQFPSTCYNSNNDRLWADFLSYTAQPTVDYYNNKAGSIYDPTGCYQTSQYSNHSCIGSGGSAIPVSTACPAPANGYTWTDYTNGVAQVAAIEAAIAVETDDDIYHALLIEHDWAVAYIARYYAFEGEYDSGGIWLENYGQYASALSFYLEAGDSTAAERVAGYIEEEGGGGARKTREPSGENRLLTAKAQHDPQFKVLARMAVDLYNNGKTWFDISERDKQTLKGIAGYNSPSGYMAAFMDTLLGIGPMLLLNPVNRDSAFMERSMERQSGNGQISNDDNNMNKLQTFNNCTIYPNPSMGTLIVQAPANGTFYLYSMLGQQVGNYTVTAGQTNITLPATLPAGVYMGRYKADNGSMAHDVRIVLDR